MCLGEKENYRKEHKFERKISKKKSMAKRPAKFADFVYDYARTFLTFLSQKLQ